MTFKALPVFWKIMLLNVQEVEWGWQGKLLDVLTILFVPLCILWFFQFNPIAAFLVNYFFFPITVLFVLNIAVAYYRIRYYWLSALSIVGFPIIFFLDYWSQTKGQVFIWVSPFWAEQINFLGSFF